MGQNVTKKSPQNKEKCTESQQFFSGALRCALIVRWGAAVPVGCCSSTGVLQFHWGAAVPEEATAGLMCGVGDDCLIVRIFLLTRCGALICAQPSSIDPARSTRDRVREERVVMEMMEKDAWMGEDGHMLDAVGELDELGYAHEDTTVFAGPPFIGANEIELHEVIAQGAFGTVYGGTCRSLQVAVKIPKKMLLTTEQRNAFESEVNIMTCVPFLFVQWRRADVYMRGSKIRHPHVCLFLGACMEEVHIRIGACDFS